MGNRLSRIVTRAGDGGKTGLSDGSRVDKDTPRMEAIGTIDELNSQIGYAQSHVTSIGGMEPLVEAITFVQHDLFDLGGGLSYPAVQLLSQAHVDRIDAIVGEMNVPLQPLKEFILPGGSPALGAFHVSRCVCRRAERRLISTLELDPQPGEFGIAYLNRLSDMLFIAARVIGRLEGHPELYWTHNKSLR